MEEDEIEAWYEAEKEKLTQELFNSMSKTKDKDVLEEKYKVDMKKLHEEYEKRIDVSLGKKKRKIGKKSEGFFKRFFKMGKK